MLRLLYSFGIILASFGIKILALFNKKLNLGVQGRKATFKMLESSISPTDKTFWFHCASLGEYEQGLPVFEALKAKYPKYKIVLSFFSPSGYEVRKHTDVADVVVYLPLDTPKNAKQFINLVNPDYTVFVKYEIWPNLLLELKKRQHKSILISSVFRNQQSFFKWYGSLMREALHSFEHIFTQNEASKELVESLGISHVSVSGDTRFDRVHKQLEIDNTISFIEDFKDNKTCIVFGSTWPEDDKLFLDFINNTTVKNMKFIIAPHNIKPNYIKDIKSQLRLKSICYSELEKEMKLSEYQVFVLDTIGYLSKAYSYADVAYVGGAAGTTGLHNILEPAAFGIPIIIGSNYQKFPEAISMISLGGVISVTKKTEFEKSIETFITDMEVRNQVGTINRSYITKNRGAVIRILDHIRI